MILRLIRLKERYRFYSLLSCIAPGGCNMYKMFGQ